MWKSFEKVSVFMFCDMELIWTHSVGWRVVGWLLEWLIPLHLIGIVTTHTRNIFQPVYSVWDGKMR